MNDVGVAERVQAASSREICALGSVDGVDGAPCERELVFGRESDRAELGLRDAAEPRVASADFQLGEEALPGLPSAGLGGLHGEARHAAWMVRSLQRRDCAASVGRQSAGPYQPFELLQDVIGRCETAAQAVVRRRVHRLGGFGSLFGSLSRHRGGECEGRDEGPEGAKQKTAW